MSQKKAIIIGAGPAGLTAAYELLEKTDIKPIIYEMSNDIGGISRTINYKGYRMDIGGHRFFSKSDVVMDWWLKFLPIETIDDPNITIGYQNQTRQIQTPDEQSAPAQAEEVMLVRNRKSRILFLRKFFDYPITLSKNTLSNLGLFRTSNILASYLHTRVFPIKGETNLEEFFINRFGKVLYQTFFKSYTEKVWGVPCSEISAEWGAQRIKGLSISKAIAHIAKKFFELNSKSVAQKDVETSLIERFLYPKLGPGQLWEYVAERVKAMGGEVHLNTSVQKLYTDDENITGVEIYHSDTKEVKHIEGDYFFSTMPVKQLIRSLQTNVPSEVREISEGLVYRDFITVGLLVEKLSITDKDKSDKLIKDNWIYVQESDVLLGRIQIFNNWSPYLVKDNSKVWLGLEYFCYETDNLWKMTDEEMAKFAIDELVKIKFIRRADVLDYTVVKVPKTYPAYFGTYPEFEKVQSYVNKFENLYLVGRNGMHRYNNQDHSMLTAMAAVDNIKHGVRDKTNIWEINTEKDYHETKSDATTTKAKATALSSVKQQLSEVSKQFIAYLFTGGTATVVDVFVFSILVKSGLWYISALCISWFFGLTTNFLLSRRFVFGVYWQNRLAQFTVFTVVGLISLLANLGLMQLLINELRWDATVARLVSAGCVALLSFAGHKLYSFASSNRIVSRANDTQG